MDDGFDLYGDADIYGGGQQADTADEPVENKVDQAKEDDSSAVAGNKRQRDDAADFDSKQAPPPPISQPAQAGGYGAPNFSQNRPSEDSSADAPSARKALAGRPKVTDPTVQNALYVGELDWWVSDENIRKIANDLGIPITLADITFSEHKVNGKSKGVAFVELADEPEAQYLKDWFENNDVNHKRATVNVSTSANGNPFRTLPKDPPPKEGRPTRGGRGGMAMGARENTRRDGQQNFPMSGAPIRMGGSNGGGMPMMNPMMMGMMGGGNGRPPFGGNNPMNFMGNSGGMGRGNNWGGRGRPMNQGMGHFNPNFFGGGRGGGGGGGGDDRERKRYRSDDNY